MRFVIVTGMSGAGKSSAMKMLEDIGYFCVDNLPSPLLPKLAEFMLIPSTEINKVALGMDIRSNYGPDNLVKGLDQLDEEGFKYEILYLDATDQVLIKRYKETRRTHPMAGTGRVDQGIAREREALKPLRERADYILDTSRLLIRDLRKEITRIFLENKEYKNLYVTIVSFGFKYGIPSDADLVFDVRFMPNPFYVAELKKKTGLDREVQDFVFSFRQTHEFMNQLEKMVTFLLPLYGEEGKSVLVIAIGCTGGHHRSVAVAHALSEYIARAGYQVTENHRDISR